MMRMRSWGGMLAVAAGMALAGYWAVQRNQVPEFSKRQEVVVNAATVEPAKKNPESLPVEFRLPGSGEFEQTAEPILVHPEIADLPRSEAVESPVNAGAIQEGEAFTTQAPRPDRENRRMPYADERVDSRMREAIFLNQLDDDCLIDLSNFGKWEMRSDTPQGLDGLASVFRWPALSFLDSIPWSPLLSKTKSTATAP